MTDLELVKRCAEKFGFEPYEDQSQWKIEAPAVACKLGIWSGQCIVYNPLTDDAQAMALAKYFMLAVDFFAQYVAAPVSCKEDIRIYFDGEGETANHAIVECVARMP
jgi:hypothetical protein